MGLENLSWCPTLLNLRVLNKDNVMKSGDPCGNSGCHMLRYSRNLVEASRPGMCVPLSTHLPTDSEQCEDEVIGPKPRSYSDKATNAERHEGAWWLGGCESFSSKKPSQVSPELSSEAREALAASPHP